MKYRGPLLVSLLIICGILNAQNNADFLIGTYTRNTSATGIYTLRCNFDSLKTDIELSAANVDNPSFLAFSEDKNYVYAVNELGDSSFVSSFQFDKITGKLNFMNQVEAEGVDPCHLAVSDKHVITANYGSGSICVFKRQVDGSLSNVIQKITHTGSSINPERQQGAHVHEVVFSPDKQFVIVTDLGTDYVYSYRYDPNAEENVLIPFDSTKVKAGSGPRHLLFHPDGKLIYLLQELDGTLTTLSYNHGNFSKVAETTIVRKKDVETGAAEIILSPDGRFLYASNRGTANDITCFKIENDGSLTFIEQTFVLGIGPRNFAISNDGRYVLVGNQQCQIITIFKRDTDTGKLSETDMSVDVGSPVCILQY
ncbi:MAG: lactonase family protein [Paludibacter sp.]|nr:lactonase family protein [Paludibacter sp.]